MILSVLGSACRVTKNLIIKLLSGVVFDSPQVLSGGQDIANWLKFVSPGLIFLYQPRSLHISPISLLP
jgi:hypothetical protein